MDQKEPFENLDVLIIKPAHLKQMKMQLLSMNYLNYPKHSPFLDFNFFKAKVSY